DRLLEAAECALFLALLCEPSVQESTDDDGGHTHAYFAHFTQKLFSGHLRHILIGHNATGIVLLN
ncbi:MAG: hypothetical protein WAK01_05740, partial [Methylocystis sp.]